MMHTSARSADWMSVHWHEVHTLFIPNQKDNIVITLEYGNQKMGSLVLDVKNIMEEKHGILPRLGYELTPVREKKKSGLTSWFFPRETPQLGEKTYAECLCEVVRIELSCEIYIATPSDLTGATLQSKARAQQAQTLFGGDINDHTLPTMPRRSKLESIFADRSPTAFSDKSPAFADRDARIPATYMPRTSDIGGPDASPMSTLPQRAMQWIGMTSPSAPSRPSDMRHTVRPEARVSAPDRIEAPDPVCWPKPKAETRSSLWR